MCEKLFPKKKLRNKVADWTGLDEYFARNTKYFTSLGNTSRNPILF